MDKKISAVKTFEPMLKDKSRMIGFLFILVAAIMVITFSFTSELLVNFLQSNFSEDHALKLSTISDIRHYYIYLIMILGSSGLFIILNLHRKAIDLFASYTDISKMHEFILVDNTTSVKKLSAYLFITGSVAGAFLIVFFAFYGRPVQEGYLEDIEALMLLAASGIMAIAASLSLYRSQKTTAYILSAFSIMIFIILGEEISWGQRIFGYQSPEFFNEYNYQGEFNLHNFFNPIYDVLYKTAGISFFVILFILWFFRKENKNKLYALLLPPPSLSFLVFLMACSTFGNREIFETLLYMFLLLYSIRTYFCVRYPNIA